METAVLGPESEDLDLALVHVRGAKFRAAGPAELAAAAAALPGVLAARLDEPDAYRAQLVGLTIHGRPCILANGFHAEYFDLFPAWESRYVFLLDGGDGVFQVLFDPAHGTCSGFRTGGEA